MAGTVRIDALPSSGWRYQDYDAVVCIDILLAGSTVVTAAAQGRRTFLAATPLDALAVSGDVGRAVRAVDLGADCPSGFLDEAGPAYLAANAETPVPLVLVSDMARLLENARGGPRLYVASLRNLRATAEHLAARYGRVAVLGVGEQGEVRSEDQMAAVWLTQMLERRGAALEDRGTQAEVARWGTADVSLLGWTRSAEQLRRAGRQRDLDLVQDGQDDLDIVCEYRDGEVRAVPAGVVPGVGEPVALGARG
jgi:phosphosulfolactate phosphohydrolase-like enzyme